MCGDHGSHTRPDAPPDWGSISLPPSHVLKHLTDAHCHPTDLNPSESDYATVSLGGLAAMATADDQEAVASAGEERPWPADYDQAVAAVASSTGPCIVPSFGYHPWFVHRFSLHDPPPPKEEHYRSILSPREAQEDTFLSLLPHLPEPEPFSKRLGQIREHVSAAKAAGRLVLVGEIGLDAAARVRVRPTHSTGDAGDWSASNLTPFKTSMAHQTTIARAQLDLAVELGVSVSVHCVAAPGATLDLLQAARKHAGAAAFSRINICIHSCGGMSPAFLKQAAKVLPNTYFSPSVSVTARSPSAAESVRMIPRERILVESDGPDVRDMTRLVWAATLWVAACRGWQVEDEHTPEWELEEEEDEYDASGRIRSIPENEVWAVRTLERNWARFMGLIM